MADVMFVIKCLLVTLVIVVLMQIRVGNRTLEGHTMNWIHRSEISHHLQDVAEGAVKVAHRGQRAVSTVIGSDEPAEIASQDEASTGWFKIKRSAAYHRQKEKEAKLQRQRLENERPLSEDERSDDDFENTDDRN